MKVEFETKITEKDLRNFNLYQAYTHSQGIISILLGIIVWTMAGITIYNGELMYGLLYIGCGFLFVIYVPVSLILRVKKTYATTEAFSKPLHYEVTDKQIKVTQGEESGELLWEQIYRIVSNEKRILIYTGRMNAYIIPREQIGESYDAFVELAQEKLEKYRLKIK